MSWLNRFRSSSRRREAHLDGELRFHLQELIDSKVAEGLSPEEARRQALIEFGPGTQVAEECRDVHRSAIVDSTIFNFKSALRFMRKSPTFSATVIVTLALGIGANSAVFSAIDAILLKQLPFPDSDRLLVLRQYDTTSKSGETFVAPLRLEDWNRMSQALLGVSGYYGQDVSETSGVLPERLSQALVAPRFLKVLGVSPILGRDFTSPEEHFGGPNAAIISYKFWRNRFHGDEQAIGKQLHLGKWSYTIVGVLPPDFAIPSHATEIWSMSPPDGPYGQARESTWFTAIGRMKPGVTVSQARVDLANVQAQLGRQYPKTDKNLVPTVRPLKLTIVGESRSSLWLLFGSVSLLLLIACTNIAALLLARTAERSREIAVRTSLGASRPSIVMQLLTESFTLALVGSWFGLFVAWGAIHAFRSFAKALPRVEEIALDWRIVVYALACALVATLLFGLVPALQATRSGTAGLLAAHSRTQVSGSNPMQWLLVGIQVALAATLLVGAALLLPSLEALGRVSPGFDASHVLTLSISADWSETGDQKKLIQRINNDLDAIRSVPGVLSAAISASLPGAADQYPTKLQLEGRSAPDSISSDSKVVSAEYFKTMRIPLIAGQGCTDKAGWATAVVNRSFADAFLGGQPTVGRHVGWADNPYGTPPSQIIGVAADARENGLHHAPVPIVYWCANNPNMAPHFLVRTEGDPLRAGASIRRALAKVEPGRSVFDIVPLEQLLFDASSENRFRTLLLTLFALTAIVLAAIGLYGTLSYFVGLRHREVGLRIALGAVPKQILRQFFTQGLSVGLLGCVTGLALGAGFSRALSGMLFGVSRADAVSYAGVAAIVLLVAAVASVLPAIRAARLDPMRALRDE